jgi:two-component system, NarL family, sensor histidine kinase DesK
MRFSRPGWGRLGSSMALVWLAFLVFPLAATLGAHPPAAELAATLAAAALFVGIYLRLVLSHTRPLPDAQGVARILALLAIATALTVGVQAAWASLFIFAAAATATVLREPLAAAGVALCALLAGLTAIAATGAVATLLFAAGTAGIGMLVLSIAGLRARNTQLHHAREELARLAVADERLRFARDLHDLLGHSLSLIALKAELAGRLLDASGGTAGAGVATPGDADAGETRTGETGAATSGAPAGTAGVESGDGPATARTHIAELEGVARGALAEVREAVTGYRRPVLATELDGARRALQAAGIQARLDRAPRALAPDVEALLAWAVREGTINAIRHSGAHSCRIAIAASAQVASVEVIDDGCGPAGAADGGHGLAGLRERAADLAGALEAGGGPHGGFRLRVSVPREPSAGESRGLPTGESRESSGGESRGLPTGESREPSTKSAPA